MGIEKLVLACPKCRSTRIYVMMKVPAPRFVDEVYFDKEDGKVVVDLTEGTAMWEDEEYAVTGEEWVVYHCESCTFSGPQSRFRLHPLVCTEIEGALTFQIDEGLRRPMVRAAIEDVLGRYGYKLVKAVDVTD